MSLTDVYNQVRYERQQIDAHMDFQRRQARQQAEMLRSMWGTGVPQDSAMSHVYFGPPVSRELSLEEQLQGFVDDWLEGL